MQGPSPRFLLFHCCFLLNLRAILLFCSHGRKNPLHCDLSPHYFFLRESTDKEVGADEKAGQNTGTDQHTWEASRVARQGASDGQTRNEPRDSDGGRARQTDTHTDRQHANRPIRGPAATTGTREIRPRPSERLRLRLFPALARRGRGRGGTCRRRARLAGPCPPRRGAGRWART